MSSRLTQACYQGDLDTALALLDMPPLVDINLKVLPLLYSLGGY